MGKGFTLQKITDEQLTRELVAWHAKEQSAQAAVIAHLLEVERRGLHLQKGYSSLFAFCMGALGMTEDVAGTRVGAVKVARDFPMVLDMLATGQLYLSSLRLLKPHLTSKNCFELLQAAVGLSKRKLEELLARWFPKPDVEPSIRKLPERKATESVQAHLADKAVAELEVKTQDMSLEDERCGKAEANKWGTNPRPRESGVDDTRAAVALVESLCSRPPQNTSSSDHQEQRHNEFTPLSAKRYKVSFTATQEQVSKIKHAQALLSHTIGDGNLGTVIERALTLLIESEEKRRFGAPRTARPHGSAGPDDEPQIADMASPHTTIKVNQVKSQVMGPAEDDSAGVQAEQMILSVHGEQAHKPEDSEHAGGGEEAPQGSRCDKSPVTIPTEPSRYIPAAVRREVYDRDGHRCTFVSSDGTRCSETRYLDFDHYKQPWAFGGPSTVDNLTLRCRAHNLWTARELWGSDYIDSKIRGTNGCKTNLTTS